MISLAHRAHSYCRGSPKSGRRRPGDYRERGKFANLPEIVFGQHRSNRSRPHLAYWALSLLWQISTRRNISSHSHGLFADQRICVFRYALKVWNQQFQIPNRGHLPSVLGFYSIKFLTPLELLHCTAPHKRLLTQDKTARTGNQK